MNIPAPGLDYSRSDLIPAPPDEDLSRQAIALTSWPLAAYTSGWCR